MTLTVSEVAQTIRKRTGADSTLPLLRVVNAAGAFLMSAHEWEWSKRNAVLLSIQANADYVPLPLDFGQLISLEATSVTIGLYSPITTADIDRLRASTPANGTGIGIKGAIAYRRSNTTNQMQPVLEIWPTASTTRTDALRLRYRARWPDVQNESGRIPLPPWPELEMVFLDIVLAYVQGHNEHDVASRAARLAEVLQGPDFMAAVDMDSGMLDTLGPLQNGASGQLDEEFPTPTFWG